MYGCDDNPLGCIIKSNDTIEFTDTDKLAKKDFEDMGWDINAPYDFSTGVKSKKEILRGYLYRIIDRI